jgi:hypothetical protein
MKKILTKYFITSFSSFSDDFSHALGIYEHHFLQLTNWYFLLYFDIFLFIYNVLTLYQRINYAQCIYNYYMCNIIYNAQFTNTDKHVGELSLFIYM